MKILLSYLASFSLFFATIPAAFSDDLPLKVLKELSLSSKEISLLLKGEIVSKKLETADKRDIAVLGAMTLNVPAEATVEAARDIKTFKEGKEILGLQKFENFDAEEMKDLILESQELADLGDCRIHDCASKLPGAWIQELSRERDESRRARLLRTLLADYAKDYAARGNEAVLDYEHLKTPVKPLKEFLIILEQSPYIKELAPDFYEYLKDYSGAQPPEIESFIYWSREKFGFKPVINLTQVSIYRCSRCEPGGYLIASRQLFADHYYDASLGLTILIDRPLRNGKPDGSYLIYINRSRIDMLGGFLSSLKRTITISRVRAGLESHMGKMKSRVESNAKNSPADTK